MQRTIQHEAGRGLRGTLALYARVWRGGREGETSLEFFGCCCGREGLGEREEGKGEER